MGFSSRFIFCWERREERDSISPRKKKSKKKKRLMIPVGGAVLAFVGLAIPAFFFLALWRNRTRLGEPATRARYGFLYCGLRLVYWDTFDTLRKLAVAAVPVFVGAQPTGSLQALVGQVIVAGTAAAVLALKPYAAAEDNWLVVASQAALFLLLLSGGALKWARLGAAATDAVASAQLALSVGLGAALVLLMVWRYGGDALRGVKRGSTKVGALAARFARRCCCGGRRRPSSAPASAAAAGKKGVGGRSGGSKVAPSRGSGSGDAEIGAAGAGAGAGASERAGGSAAARSFGARVEEKGKKRASASFGGGAASGGSGGGGGAAGGISAAPGAAAPPSSAQLLRSESAAGSGDSTAALLSPRGLY